MKHIFFVSLLLLAALFPEVALAKDTIGPVGVNPDNSAWNMYVVGNGFVVREILNSISLLIAPGAGSTGFKTLLLFLATVGFLTLAVGAGFDPSKNLIKMFTYILTVWAVVYSTTTLKVNLYIEDRMAPAVLDYEPLLRDVPASVGLPAAIVSAIGKYFSETMENVLHFPGDEQYFAMSGNTADGKPAIGQFNLFGRMMKEATQYRITDPELKRTVSSYMSDCVVPAMHLGRLEGKSSADSPVCDGGKCYGTNALLYSTNYVEMLGTANLRGVMTKYFPTKGSDWKTYLSSDDQGSYYGMSNAEAEKVARATGILVSCETSFFMFGRPGGDLDRHAQNLFNGDGQTWATTGVQVPLETAFRSMLTAAAPPGTPTNAMSSPNGFIMQQGLINSMKGAFRGAAAQTGNNEIMQAAALSQAEAMQTSSWVASFNMFNNMMGYVFCVLQAFIFAMVPFVIIALMVPGMGRGVFVNYSQILIWLTLWEPMLTIINYIITLFSVEGVRSALAASGGAMTPGSIGEVSERINDLVVAAQFLGTMTPLIAWGIVKGALAFTEFISQGVGSAFASQAGASAATGNLSMNNMSMDNASLNKFSSQMSSAVGFSNIDAPLNAAAMNMTHNAGGTNATLGGGKNVDATQAISQRASETVAKTEAASSAASQANSKNVSLAKQLSDIASVGTTQSTDVAIRTAVSEMKARGFSDSQVHAVMAQAQKNLQESANVAGSNGTKVGMSAEVSANLGLFAKALGGGKGASLGGGMDWSTHNDAKAAASLSGSASEGTAQSDTGSTGRSYSHNLGSGKETTSGESKQTSRSGQQQRSASESEVVSAVASKMKSYSDSVSRNMQSAKEWAKSAAIAMDIDGSANSSRLAGLLDDMNARAHQAAALDSSVQKDFGAMRQGAKDAVAGSEARNGPVPDAVAVSKATSSISAQGIRAETRGIGAGVEKRAGEHRQHVAEEDRKLSKQQSQASQNLADKREKSDSKTDDVMVNVAAGAKSATPNAGKDVAVKYMVDEPVHVEGAPAAPREPSPPGPSAPESIVRDAFSPPRPADGSKKN